MTNVKYPKNKNLITKIGKDESTKEEKINHFFFACPVGDPVVDPVADPERCRREVLEGSRVEGCFCPYVLS